MSAFVSCSEFGPPGTQKSPKKDGGTRAKGQKRGKANAHHWSRKEATRADGHKGRPEAPGPDVRWGAPLGGLSGFAGRPGPEGRLGRRGAPWARGPRPICTKSSRRSQLPLRDGPPPARGAGPGVGTSAPPRADAASPPAAAQPRPHPSPAWLQPHDPLRSPLLTAPPVPCPASPPAESGSVTKSRLVHVPSVLVSRDRRGLAMQAGGGEGSGPRGEGRRQVVSRPPWLRCARCCPASPACCAPGTAARRCAPSPQVSAAPRGVGSGREPLSEAARGTPARRCSALPAGHWGLSARSCRVCPLRIPLRSRGVAD